MMTWMRVDVAYFRHPKVVAVGPAAAYLNLAAIGYATEHLTDGYIDAKVTRTLHEVRGRVRLVNALCEAGLWTPEGDGYRLHGFLEWQISRADAEAYRERERQRMRRVRANKARTYAVGSQDVRPTEVEVEVEIDTLSSSTGNSRGAQPPLDDDDETSPQQVPDEPEPSEPEPWRPVAEPAVLIGPDDPLAWLVEPVTPEPEPVPIPADVGGRVAAAVQALAYGDLLARQAAGGAPIGDSRAWLAKAAARRQADDGERLAGLAHAHPTADAKALAALVGSMGTGEQAQSSTATDDSRNAQQAAERERQRRGNEQVQALRNLVPDPQASERVADLRRVLGPQWMGDNGDTEMQ